ncbi:MAG: hypothetical protein ABRQ38_08450 [Candidatus Eremiobacterota bacterium]
MKPNDYKPKENSTVRITYRANDTIEEYLKEQGYKTRKEKYSVKLNLLSDAIINTYEPLLSEEARNRLKSEYSNEGYNWFTRGNFIQFDIECTGRNKEKVFNLLDKLPGNEECELFHIEPYTVKTINKIKLMNHLKGKGLTYNIPGARHSTHWFFIIRNENLPVFKKFINDTLDEIDKKDKILLKITLNETKDLSVIARILGEI